MKAVTSWTALEPFGIVVLTGEACALGYRILCDLTEKGKRTVERCLSVEISSESWNSGSNEDRHVASIMLTQEMLVPLAVFALLDSGCREVWTTQYAAFGVEDGDSEEDVSRLRQSQKMQRRFSFHGPFQDRNQHLMSGRVR